jgi:hypothetical protein
MIVMFNCHVPAIRTVLMTVILMHVTGHRSNLPVSVIKMLRIRMIEDIADKFIYMAISQSVKHVAARSSALH